MTTKKLIGAGLAAVTLAAAAPAFADGWHKRGHGHWRSHERVVVQPRYYYAPPPRVVVYERPAVVYRPAPVYYAQPAYGASVSGDAALGIFAGAAIGALIGYELSH